MLRRPLTLLSATVLTVAGFASPALAGTGQSAACPTVVAGSPVTLGLDVTGLPTTLGICYSTSPAGDPAAGVTGGEIVVNVVPSPTVPRASVTCTADTNPLIAPVTCTNIAMTAPSATVTGTTVTVQIPFSVCTSSNLAGTVCNTGNPTLSRTGVVVGTIALSSPDPNYPLGATLVGTTVWVDGFAVPLTGGGVGADPGAVGPGTVGYGTQDIQVCFLTVPCQNVPQRFWIGTAQIPIAVLVLGGPVPVTVPAQCIISVGLPCPPGY